MRAGPPPRGRWPHSALRSTGSRPLAAPGRLLPGMQPGAGKRNVLVALCYLLATLVFGPRLVDVVASLVLDGGT